MADWNDNRDVSPYLQQPLRSYEEAVEDLRRFEEAAAQARLRNRKGVLVPFPHWQRRSAHWLRTASGGLRRLG